LAKIKKNVLCIYELFGSVNSQLGSVLEMIRVVVELEVDTAEDVDTATVYA